MMNLQKILALNEKAKKLPRDQAKKAALIGMEMGRKMRKHVNAMAKKAST